MLSGRLGWLAGRAAGWLAGWLGDDGGMWPSDLESLVARQRDLAAATPPPWQHPSAGALVGGCWVCFPRGLTGRGGAGDPAWTAAVVLRDGVVVDQRVTAGVAGAPYLPGALALRIGSLMEDASRALVPVPDVLLLDATGRDHPRRAGLALHLGEVLGVPTVGITHRPLVAEGEWPGGLRGETSLLRIDDEVVACWMRTQPGVRPLVVHPGWRVDLATAVDVVAATTVEHRTPEPLRRARRAAREARAAT